MSVCIAATYPWEGIRNFPGLGQPGAIMLTDTRVTQDRKVVRDYFFAKQRRTSPNIAVGYTSANGQATTYALNALKDRHDVKSIGKALKHAHYLCGGFTEALVVVWANQQPPQVLELMPPKYEPKQRTGVVGIGDASVLDWFVEHFSIDLTPAGLAARGMPIQDAMLWLSIAFTNGIREAGGPTVGLPVECSVISEGKVMRTAVFESQNLGENWNSLTANPKDLRIPQTDRIWLADQFHRPRTARQLLP